MIVASSNAGADLPEPVGTDERTGVVRRFNALGVVPTVEAPTARTFYSRPFLVLMADRLADACFAALEDPWLRSLPPTGGVDQYLDSTDALSPERARRTSGMLTAEPRPTLHRNPVVGGF